MNTQRKLQLGAAAVIANGIIALSAMTPAPALAAACSDNNDFICGVCAPGFCQPVSGCTLSVICYNFCPGIGTICSYQ